MRSRSKPTHWEGSRALLAGGFAARASRSKPTCQEGFRSLPVGGFAARGYFTEYSQNIINLVHKAPAPHPPTRRDTPLPGRLPLCTVGRDQKP